MKNLIVFLVVPLAIVSFVVVTKSWVVVPVDAPETVLYGFPFPFVCAGWHTSMSYQFFVVESFIDFTLYFIFWALAVYVVNRWVANLHLSRLFKVLSYLVVSCTCIMSGFALAIGGSNLFYLNRPWQMEVISSGIHFIWQW
jgi:hypothetical protein